MCCPLCPTAMEVSDQDADASQSGMLNHLFREHAGFDHDRALELLAKVEVTRK